MIVDWNAVATIASLIAVINGGFVWAVKWLLSSNWKKLSQEISDVHNAHNDLKEELTRLKGELPEKYVRREDWIMGFSRIEQKIDAIWNYIHQQSKGA